MIDDEVRERLIAAGRRLNRADDERAAALAALKKILGEIDGDLSDHEAIELVDIAPGAVVLFKNMPVVEGDRAGDR